MENCNLKEVEEKIIYIEDIGVGLKNYRNAILTIKKENVGFENIKKFIKDINEEIIVDYYGNKIEDNEFEMLLKTLSKDEGEYLKKIREKESKDIFFTNIEEKFLSIIMKLSFNEILFSSFYLGNKITIWGNFNKEFVIFFNEEVEVREYEMLAKKNGLKIKDLRMP